MAGNAHGGDLTEVVASSGLASSELAPSGRRRKIVARLVVLTAVVAFALWVWERDRVRRLHGRFWSPEQMQCLATIHVAQEQFRAAAYVDQDGDGAGEYGTLSELAGLDGRRTVTGEPTGIALIPPELGLDALEHGGIGVWEGICFRVDLTTGTGLATCSPGGPAPTQAAIDAQESRYIAYSWGTAVPAPAPVAVTPDSTFYFRSPSDEARGVYVGREDPPAPGAAFVPTPPRTPGGLSLDAARTWNQDPENSRVRRVDDLEGEMADWDAGGDGARWLIVSDGFVGWEPYGAPLDPTTFARPLKAMLQEGLPPPAPPVELPRSPAAQPVVAQPVVEPPVVEPPIVEQVAGAPPPADDASDPADRATSDPADRATPDPADGAPDLADSAPDPADSDPRAGAADVPDPSAPRWLEVPLEDEFVIVLRDTPSMEWFSIEITPTVVREGDSQNRWALAAHQLEHLLQAAGPERSFGLVLYHGASWQSELAPCTPANVAEAMTWLRQQPLRSGFVNVNRGVRAVCNSGLSCGQILIVTNGLSSTGVHTSKVLEAANTCGARLDLVLLVGEGKEELFQPAITESGGAVHHFP